MNIINNFILKLSLTSYIVVYRGVFYVTFEYPYTDMTSVDVSVFQEARDRIDRDISSIIQLLNEKKNTLFGEITVLENEFKSKQQQKLNSLNKLESLKTRTEEELGDNLLSEIQARVTQELQNGINKINQEMKSLTVDYRIAFDWDWDDRIHGMKQRVREFRILIVQTHQPNKKFNNKTRGGKSFNTAYKMDEPRGGNRPNTGYKTDESRGGNRPNTGYKTDESRGGNRPNTGYKTDESRSNDYGRDWVDDDSWDY